MIKIIILGTGSITSNFINIFHKDIRFNLVGVILDTSSRYYEQENLINQLNKMELTLIEFDKLSDYKYDVIITFEYRKLVPRELLQGNFFLNVHAGILPKYRGFHSNAFAILNGENQIGYSLHQMDEIFDNGKLFVVKKFKITNLESYGDVRPKMIDHMYNNIPSYIFDIMSGKILPKEQKTDEGVIYGVKLNPLMGNIGGFNLNTKNLILMHKVFKPPLGSGLFFTFKGVKYIILELDDAANYGVSPFYGFPGKIINVFENIMFVKTEDSTIAISNVINSNTLMEVSILDVFKIGNQL